LSNAREQRPGFFALVPLANRFPALHGIRFLAIVLVVQVHVTNAFFLGQIPMSTESILLSQSVFFGMDLFFILSGFLIGSMLLYSLEQNQRQQVWRFYLRRTFRIFPLYYV
jgi:peptidoglycan/LPS O-acetylase OafA/YrhL